ncbi:MAG: riboflavin synthase [Ignavibacteria bacterium]|nr:riboflavin synthase [Ignavibacteria bacterium]
MFTGLVEETGTIKEMRRRKGSIIFTVEATKTAKDLDIDNSIAVNGVCLTVIRRKGRQFDVQAVEETLRKTSLGSLEISNLVNLERPLRASDRLGGHFVLGHVDATGTIVDIEDRKSSWMFWIRYPKRFRKYLIPVGSIAVDGVSLTIASLRRNEFGVSIIPYTMDVTTFKDYRIGTTVNLEYDVLAKYAESFLKKH